MILIGLLGSLNAQVMTGSRITSAMAGDGEFPRVVSRLSPRFGTPVVALWLQAAWTIVLMALQRVDQLIAYATAAMLMIGIMSVLSVILLRRRRPDAERPYRTLAYPVTPLLYCVSSAGVLVILVKQVDVSVLLAVAWFALALVLHRLFRRPTEPPNQSLSQ
jgi:APA family basic amino acid/polyamine antiporter